MFPEKFSFGRIIEKVIKDFPSFRFRDRDAMTHYASGATECGRKLTYQALKEPASNPPDTLGQIRMRMGSWVEKGLQYEIFGKMAPYGIIYIGSQGDAGEHGSFYGTSWHGYRDGDFLLKQATSSTPFVVELKAKIGYGGAATVKEAPWKKGFIIPEPDQEWGYSQQLALYLRDNYLKTKDNPQFKTPIKDGILLYFCYDDGLAAFVEFHAEYIPENDTVHYYRTVCHQIPECNGPLDITINLREVAEYWKKQDSYLKKGELAPPDYAYKWDITDERVFSESKTNLTKAIKGDLVLGDLRCRYCSFKDKCAKDLNINQGYSRDEVAELKRILAKK